jgi:hypothetical protein
MALTHWNGRPFKDYAWCCDCERAWPVREWEDERGNCFCPGSDCRGSSMDARPWELVRTFDSSYPVEPERGRAYEGPAGLYPPP